jgi:hypothetical protein
MGMETENKGLIYVRDCPCDGCEAKPCGHPAKCVKFALWLNKTVDAVPVDEFRLHHILIDNEGVPEVKLQFGDRYVILRTDPVDVRQVVHGYTLIADEPKKVLLDRKCGICDQLMLATDNYCPMCGAMNDGEKIDGLMFADMEEIIDATD